MANKKKVAKVMGEFKRGKLRSGSKTGPKVKKRKQAVAIAMSEAGMAKPKRKKAMKGGKVTPSKRRHYAEGGPSDRQRKLMEAMGRAEESAGEFAGTVANSPMTLAGLIKSLLGGGLPRVDAEGNLIGQGSPAPGGQGQTMGEIMFLHPDLPETQAEADAMGVDTRAGVLEHEKEHVDQGRRLGPLYPVLNVLDTLIGGGYENNEFEHDAEMRRKYADGGEVEGITWSDLQGITPFTDPYEFRYGVSAEEKDAKGRELRPTAHPQIQDRSGGAYLGTKKWGSFLPQLFNEVRNATGIAALMGDEDPEALREAGILAASRAIDDAYRERPEPTRWHQSRTMTSTPIRGARGGRAHYAMGGPASTQYLQQQGGLNPLMAGDAASRRQAAKTASLRDASHLMPKARPRGGLPGGGVKQGGARPKPAAGGGGTLAEQSYAAYQRGEKSGIPGGMSFADYQSTYFGGGGVGGGGAGGAGVGGGTFGKAETAAGNLANFQPLTGTAAGTHEQMLASGAPVDVAGATEAARTLAGQEFDQARNALGERYAALGLGSSTASDAAVARERAKMGERIGAAGLQAEIAANENAANRRFGSVGQALTGSGQRLAGQQGSMQGLMGLTGIAEGGRQFDIGQENQMKLGMADINTRRDIASQGFQHETDMFNAMNAPNAYGSTSSASFNPLAGGTTLGFRAASGGRASDHLAKLAYGTTFDPTEVPELSEISRGTIRTPEYEDGTPRGSSRSRGPRMPDRDELLRMYKDQLRIQDQFDQKREGRAESRRRNAIREAEAPRYSPTPVINTQFGVGTLNPGRAKGGYAWDQRTAASPASAGGSMRSGSMYSNRANRVSPGQQRAARAMLLNDPRMQAAMAARVGGGNPKSNRRYGAMGGGAHLPDMPYENGVSSLSLETPRRQFYEGGGDVPGVDDGTDKIPAMLRSEELVVTPELAQDIQSADPMIPQPELITALQDLYDKPLEFSEEDGEYVAAKGGTYKRGEAPLDWLFDLSLEDPRREGGDFGYIMPGDVPILAEPPELDIPGLEGLPMLTPDLDPDQYMPRRDPSEIPLLPEGVGRALTDISASPGSVSITQADGSPIDKLSTPGNVMGQTITPQPDREGSFSAMKTTVPSAQPLTPEQREQQAYERAMNRRDMLNAALNADPVGSPEKQSRLQSALAKAQGEVDAIAAQMETRKNREIAEAALEIEEVKADAVLNSSVADKLRAQALNTTADANYAKVLQDAAANDPVVAQLLNTLETSGLAKTERGAEMGEAILTEILRARGVNIEENGWFMRLFGAPRFEIAPNPDAFTQAPEMGRLTPEEQAFLADFGIYGQ